MSEGLQALSEREKETLRLLLGGHDIKSIAARLGLSVHTVNERLREARRKLGASSSRQAARILAEVEQGAPNSHADKESGVVRATFAAADEGRVNHVPGRGHPVAWLGGGMLIMSLIIATAVVLMMAEGAPRTRPPAPGTMDAAAPASAASAASARAWLALADRGDWSKSWSAAGSLFRSKISPQEWAAKAEPVREPLGPVSSRVLQKVIKATSLPGVPDGQYEILQFATSFANKADAIETVTLAHDPSGWKVDGYFIR